MSSNGSFSIFFFSRIFNREGNVVSDHDGDLLDQLDEDLCNEVMYNEGIDFQYTSSGFRLIYNEEFVTEDYERVSKDQVIDIFQNKNFEIYEGGDWVYRIQIEGYQIEEYSFEMKEPDVE